MLRCLKEKLNQQTREIQDLRSQLASRSTGESSGGGAILSRQTEDSSFLKTCQASQSGEILQNQNASIFADKWRF